MFVLTGALPVAAHSQQAPAAALVFDGVTVVDVTTGKLQPARRVVLVGNRIHTVGTAATVVIPAGAQVVRARGKYLIPGLWDLWTQPDTVTGLIYPLLLTYGVTGIVSLPSSDYGMHGLEQWRPSLDTLVYWRQAILAGTRVGPPRQLLGRNANERDLEHRLDSLKAAGLDVVWASTIMNYKLAAVTRRAGLLISSHIPDQRVGQNLSGTPTRPLSVAEATDSGLNIVSQISGGLDSLCLDRASGAGRKASVERCRSLAERMRRNNSWWMPMLSLAGTPIGMGKTSFTLFKDLEDRSKQFWADAASAPTSLASVSNPLGALRLPHRVGLPILTGTGMTTDTLQIRTSLPGLALHTQLAVYTAEGLTPLEALQTATYNPAKLLHATDSLGTVAAGKLADMVLLDANPMADIANTTKIRAVVANGRYFDRAALDSLQAEVRAHKVQLRSHP